jgi:hypothetical protein
MDHIQDELLASPQGGVHELARANGELRHGDLWSGHGSMEIHRAGRIP